MQLVKQLSRLDNVLGVVLTNSLILIQSICNCEPFGFSDHLSVEFAVNLSNATNLTSMHGEDNTYKLFLWKDIHWPAFADFINNVDWFDMLTINLTGKSLWCALTRTINDAIELFVPLKHKTRKPNCRPRGVFTLITSSVSSLVSVVGGEVTRSQHTTM